MGVLNIGRYAVVQLGTFDLRKGESATVDSALPL